MLRVQDTFFFTGKNMAAQSELILQMLMYFPAGSHVKPLQMRAGRKEHENNERRHMALFCVYVGCELICDGKLTKIPKRDFIFARVKTGQVGTWSPIEYVLVQSFSLGHIRIGILREGSI